MNSYIHIPFCRQKCPYCKFALTPIFDAAKKRRYLAYLENEVRAYFSSPSQRDGKTDTIYFGGGTPSVLTLEEIKILLSCFEKRNEQTEISFESNPEDITTHYVSGLFDLGINRLSLGIQSLNDITLEAIHRSNRESIIKALESIKYTLTKTRRNISINIDFILGLPFAKPGETLANIRELHKKYPYITHTSVYMLEDGLYPKEWKHDSVNEREMELEYAEICTYFESLGWCHYEISNWSKSGYQCIHNQGYWKHSNSRGFGLSATSYIEGNRWENSHSFTGYYRGDYTDEENLTEDQQDLEKIIFDTRTFSLDFALFETKKLEQLIEEKYIMIHKGKIVLTPTGILRENTIISELLKNKKKKV